jgi:hypothetical protein
MPPSTRWISGCVNFICHQSKKRKKTEIIIIGRHNGHLKQRIKKNIKARKLGNINTIRHQNKEKNPVPFYPSITNETPKVLKQQGIQLSVFQSLCDIQSPYCSNFCSRGSKQEVTDGFYRR